MTYFSKAMEKFFKSFVYAFKGLAYALRTQLNFKLHCVSAVCVILLGLYTKLSSAEWLWIVLAIAMVLVLELVNTAIETLVDLVSPQQQAKAGIVKDVAAAAVLVAAFLALSIALIIFVPKFI